jgi:hypothetical protein
MSIFSFLKIDQSKLIPMMLRDWILTIKNKPENDIKAFNFGIFQEASFKNNYTVYLIGVKRYDLTNNDWACEGDYEPTMKYMRFPGTNKMKWEEILEIVKNGISMFIKSEDYNKSILSNAEVITVGIDDGELFRIK